MIITFIMFQKFGGGSVWSHYLWAKMREQSQIPHNDHEIPPQMNLATKSRYSYRVGMKKIPGWCLWLCVPFASIGAGLMVWCFTAAFGFVWSYIDSIFTGVNNFALDSGWIPFHANNVLTFLTFVAAGATVAPTRKFQTSVALLLCAVIYLGFSIYFWCTTISPSLSPPERHTRIFVIGIIESLLGAVLGCFAVKTEEEEHQSKRLNPTT